jgi:phosphoglycolate phosphatase-like HAD superfamily hydrolase
VRQQLRLVLLACDWNGTLVDDEGRARAATNRVLRDFDSQPLGPTPFRRLFKLPLETFFTENGIPARHVSTAVQAWNDHLSAFPAQLRTGVHELLGAATAESIPVGVISAARTDVVRGDAAALGVLEDLSFIQGNIADKSALLAKLVADTDGLVGYLGDTEHDMVAALKGGALPLALSGGYKPISALRTAGARVIVRDLRTLARALAGPALDEGSGARSAGAF